MVKFVEEEELKEPLIPKKEEKYKNSDQEDLNHNEEFDSAEYTCCSSIVGFIGLLSLAFIMGGVIYMQDWKFDHKIRVKWN